MIAIAVTNLLLFFFGETASASVSTRRRGGADTGKNLGQRYEWTLDYTFKDKNGVSYSGNTTRPGSDISVKTDDRVYYFTFAPFIHALERDAEPNLIQPLFFGIGILLLYAMNRRKRVTGSRVDDAYSSDNENNLDERIISMFCVNCGAKLAESSYFCENCGAAVAHSQPEKQNALPNLVGFSPMIENHAFASYKRKSITWSFIFSGILAIIAIIGFPIYGSKSGEIEWPYSLYYGIVIGCMFIVIALGQTLKKKLDKTWDGVVEFKNVTTVRERSRKGYRSYHNIYVMKIRKDSGGVKKHRWRDASIIYDYLQVGDRVRHHKGLTYYEKFDKSKDSKIMCAACLTFVDKDKDVCPRCKCPILK